MSSTVTLGNFDKAGQVGSPINLNGGAFRAQVSGVGSPTFTLLIRRGGSTIATLTESLSSFQTSVPGEYSFLLNTLSGQSASVLLSVSSVESDPEDLGISYPRSAFLIGDSITARGNYTVSVSALSQQGGRAVAVATSHGLFPGSEVFIGAADQEEYNGLKTVLTRESSSQFTFEVPATAVAATGTIIATANSRFSDRNWFEMANMSVGHPFNVRLNAGVSGDTTSEMRARFDRDVLQYVSPGDIVQIQGGINDITATSAGQEEASLRIIKGNFLNMIQRTIAKGAIPLVVTCLPISSNGTGYSAAAVNMVLTLNQYLRELADYLYGEMILFDGWAAVVDPVATTGGFLATPVSSSYTQDGTHPTALAAQKMAAKLALILPSLRYPRTQYVGSILDSYDTDSSNRQIDPNPLNIGTGGTKSVTGSGTNTGSVPNNYTNTLTSAASATCTNAVAARSDGFGNDFLMVFTGAAASDAVDVVQTSQLHARVSAGDVLVSEGHLRVTGITNISNISYAFEWASGGVTYTQPGAVFSAASGQLSDDIDWIIRTPKLVVPPAGMTGLKTRLKVTGAGAGATATIRWGRHCIVKCQ